MVGRTCYERLNATTVCKQSEEKPVHANPEETDDVEARVGIAVGCVNYVSCSHYRMSIARLAACAAAIGRPLLGFD